MLHAVRRRRGSKYLKNRAPRVLQESSRAAASGSSAPSQNSSSPSLDFVSDVVMMDAPPPDSSDQIPWFRTQCEVRSRRQHARSRVG